MKRTQAGFTMIELIVVIVILGILAATALPKFLDLRTNANESAVAGMAGSLGSAMTVNYAGCSATNHDNGSVVAANAAKCSTVDNCQDGGSLLQGGLPSGYTITSTDLTTTNGTTAECTLVKDAGSADEKEAKFVGIAAGN